MAEKAFNAPWPRVLLFGGSTTQRCFEQTGGWGTLLAERLQRRCDVIARGFGGYTSRHGRVILPRVIDADDAASTAVVVIFLGSNDSSTPVDSLQYVPIGEYKANMAAMVHYLQSIGVSKDKIILVGSQACDVEAWGLVCKQMGWLMSKDNMLSRDYSEACRSVALTYGLDFVDLHGTMMATWGWQRLLADGLHLSAQGAKLLFDLLWPLVYNKTRHLPFLLPRFADIDYSNPALSLLLGKNDN